MSAITSPVIEIVAPIVVKAPVLSGKYSKFQVFGYWFIQQMSNGDAITVEKMYETLKLFSSVEEQSEYFQLYLDETKIATKNMKAEIKKQKSPKDKKTKKSTNDSEVKDPVKRGRRKKEVAVVCNFRDDLVSEMVGLANGRPVAITAIPNEEANEVAQEIAQVIVNDAVANAVIKETDIKVKSKKNTSKKVEDTNTETDAVEVPKRKYSRKTKDATVAPVEPVEQVAPVAPVAPVEPSVKKMKALEKVKSVFGFASVEATEPIVTVEVAEPVVAVEAPIKRKYSRKPKDATIVPIEVAVEAPVEVAVEAAVEVATQEEDEEEEEEEDEAINCVAMTIDGVKYAVDYENETVYDYKTQEEIGVYHTDTKTITLN